MLTSFQRVKVRARSYIDCYPVHRNDNIEDRNEPPISNHWSDAIYQLSEKDEKTELDRHQRAPRQYEGSGGYLVIPQGIFNEARSQLNIRDAEQQSFGPVHLVDEQKQQYHRSDQAACADQQENIVNPSLLLHTKADIESCTDAEEADDEENNG